MSAEHSDLKQKAYLGGHALLTSYHLHGLYRTLRRAPIPLFKASLLLGASLYGIGETYNKYNEIKETTRLNKQ